MVIDRVQSFAEKNRGQSVMCFTDGAASDSEIGIEEGVPQQFSLL